MKKYRYQDGRSYELLSREPEIPQKNDFYLDEQTHTIKQADGKLKHKAYLFLDLGKKRYIVKEQRNIYDTKLRKYVANIWDTSLVTPILAALNGLTKTDE